MKAFWQGAWHEFAARREIILCAGAVGSPGILQRSGIGPRQLLETLGIGVRHDMPGVGGNLQDHLQLRLIYQIRNTRTLNQMANSLWGKMGMGLRYLYDRSGPLAMAPSQLGAFVRSSPDQATANLQYHVQPLSLERFGEPLHQFPAFTASVCNLRPASRGRIDICSTDMNSTPLINPNYLSDPQDLRVAADAIRLTRRIVQAPALAAFEPKEYLPGPACNPRRSCSTLLARSAPPSSTRSVPAAWAMVPWMLWITSCAYTASPACAWQMPRSCRRSPPAIPVPHPDDRREGGATDPQRSCYPDLLERRRVTDALTRVCAVPAACGRKLPTVEQQE